MAQTMLYTFGPLGSPIQLTLLVNDMFTERANRSDCLLASFLSADVGAGHARAMVVDIITRALDVAMKLRLEKN